MKSNCDLAIKETLKWEGGYTNNPADPGGPTNWGITIIDARKYWKKDASAADVKAMPLDVAVSIYRNKYWVNKFYNCDDLPTGVDLTVFDFGVNSGPARAVKYLNAEKGNSVEDQIKNINDKRLKFLQGLPTWNVFRNGWTSRIVGIKAKSLQMAAGGVSAGTKSAGAIIAGTVAASASAPHDYLPWIVGGGVVLAVIAFILFETFAYKKD
jgi:lysozyme family protein